MSILETERLRLREMTDADLDDIAALLGDPEAMRYYPRPKTRAEAQDWIDWNRRNYAEHGFGLWTVETRDGGGFVGDCGLTPQRVDGAQEVEIGYHVRAAAQGNGYATEAATASLALARRLGLRRVIAIIDPANEASQRVATKLGMRLEKATRVFGRQQAIYAVESDPQK